MQEKLPPQVDLLATLESIEGQIDSAIGELRELDRLSDQIRAISERYNAKLETRCERITNIMADVRGIIEIINEMSIVSVVAELNNDDDTLDLPKVPQL